MKKIIIIIVAIAVLVFTYWTISPLFITNEVQDELPTAITEVTEPMTEEEMQEIIASMPDVEMDEAMPTPIRIETVPSVREEPAQPVVFEIEDTRGHPATGQIRIVETNDGNYVRFENYDGTNGPDLFVYLAKDLNATEFVNLGRAKGNKGNINYEVPADVDISEYRYVMTWCDAFSTLFDYAEIN